MTLFTPLLLFSPRNPQLFHRVLHSFLLFQVKTLRTRRKTFCLLRACSRSFFRCQKDEILQGKIFWRTTRCQSIVESEECFSLRNIAFWGGVKDREQALRYTCLRGFQHGRRETNLLWKRIKFCGEFSFFLF